MIIGFFKDAESANAKAFLAAADSQDTLYFGIVTNKEVAASLEANFDSVVVFKKFDEGRATFDGEYTAEEIIKFVYAEQLPLLTVFSDQVGSSSVYVSCIVTQRPVIIVMIRVYCKFYE